MKNPEQQQSPSTIIVRSLRRNLWVGIGVGAVFFVGLGGWSAYAPIAGAALAPGVVSADGSRRTVQHLEGGIVRELFVREGATVKAGQELIVLEANGARATHDSLFNKLRTDLARRARLIASRDGADLIEFPPELLATLDNEEVRTLIETQRNVFESRRAAREQRKKILQQRSSQLYEEIEGRQAQAESQAKQLALLEEEAKGVAKLVKDGYERRPRLLALQRNVAEVTGERAGNLASIAKARQAITETHEQIVSIGTEHQEDIGTKLAEVMASIAETQEKLRAAADVVRRTVIVAPVDGTVVQLRVHTIGGVVTAGQAILDIVPQDDELVIDARVSPSDIDEVRPNQSAQVVMTGYSMRNAQRLTGTVRTVSADRIVDSSTGQPYYLARIELPAGHVREVAPEIELKPGMPAEVMVVTGERTLFNYLVEPLVASFRHSFRQS